MRLGKMRAPYYRIVVADSRTKRDGRAIEEIGKYHPKEDPSFIEVKSDRVQYWLGVGAQPTESVAALLRVTGDWQKFKGEPAPAPMKVAAPKPDKKAAYEEAARAAMNEPTSDATTPRKKAAPRRMAARAVSSATPPRTAMKRASSVPASACRAVSFSRAGARFGTALPQPFSTTRTGNFEIAEQTIPCRPATTSKNTPRGASATARGPPATGTRGRRRARARDGSPAARSESRQRGGDRATPRGGTGPRPSHRPWSPGSQRRRSRRRPVALGGRLMEVGVVHGERLVVHALRELPAVVARIPARSSARPSARCCGTPDAR